LELRARLDLPTLGHDSAGTPSSSPRAEARAALAELGYAPDEIRTALESVGEDGPVQEMVRTALRELARSR
jgi:Holliday junction resolvasome RuvABC DNA-binding subunit